MCRARHGASADGLIALTSAPATVTTPLVGGFMRANESAADLFALNAARQPDAQALALLKLADYRKLDPGPVEEFLFFDHPSGRTRIHMAMRWKAESAAF